MAQERMMAARIYDMHTGHQWIPPSNNHTSVIHHSQTAFFPLSLSCLQHRTGHHSLSLFTEWNRTFECRFSACTQSWIVTCQFTTITIERNRQDDSHQQSLEAPLIVQIDHRSEALWFAVCESSEQLIPQAQGLKKPYIPRSFTTVYHNVLITQWHPDSKWFPYSRALENHWDTDSQLPKPLVHRKPWHSYTVLHKTKSTNDYSQPKWLQAAIFC